jgi:hypothetical protein
MTETTCQTDPRATSTPTAPATAPAAAAPTTADERTRALEVAEGWQALALAVLDRELTGPELAAAERLPVEVALDLLFPGLDDAARHEALWALDGATG